MLYLHSGPCSPQALLRSSWLTDSLDEHCSLRLLPECWSLSLVSEQSRNDIIGGKLTWAPVWTALEASYEKQVDAGGVVNTGYAKGVLAMIVLYNTSFNIGWTPLQVTYVCEILPYNLRARVYFRLFYSTVVAAMLTISRVLFCTASQSRWH